MGYNSENPPEYIEDLIKEYDLKVKECGYMRGSWVTLKSDDLGLVKLKLSPPDSIEVRKSYYGSLSVNIPVKNGIGLVEKNRNIQEQVNDILIGYDSFKQALENEA